MKKIALNILVLTATLLLTLAVVEVALRWLMPVDYRPPASELPNVARDIIYQKSSVPGLDYELVPNMDTTAHGARVKINSAGMRDDEPDPALPKIVVLGDSFSFGFQLEQDESFPARLDAALDTADVLNLAVAGYAMKDYVAVLKNKGLAWQPEVIIVGYVLNDPETEAIQQIPAYFRQADWWQYSHVLRLFAQGYKRAKMLIKGGGNYYRYLHADPTSWQSVVTGFEQIRQMAAENDSRVIVVLFPDLWHNWDSYPYAAIHRQVAGQAAANGFEVIDLRDAFSAYPPAELRVSGSDAHPNALANQIAADEILKRLNP
ncbi:MAG: hypothetical protein D6768_00445 [Chloroflexi bacterium]|nr:MAG: hypothetical protein D6768_00445 [Chloroflexota bacterium]